MKRIALLGANGQLGTDISRVFAGNPAYEIVPVTRKELNLENTETIIPYLEKLAPLDAVINCTAFTNTEACQKDPLKALVVNSIALHRIAVFCKQADAALFHFSTDYVFDGMKETPYAEDDATYPLNVYGSTKAAGEKVVAAYMDHYFIFRVSSLFGAAGSSGKGGNFVETMIRQVRQGKPVSVVDDIIMSPTHTMDVAKAVYAFFERDVSEYGIYHCSSEGACSWYEFAVTAFGLYGIDFEAKPIPSGLYESTCKRPAYSVLDSAKLGRYYRMPHWKSALEQYLLLKGHVAESGGQP